MAKGRRQGQAAGAWARADELVGSHHGEGPGAFPLPGHSNLARGESAAATAVRGWWGGGEVLDERENLGGGEGSWPRGGRERRRPVCPAEAAFDSRRRLGSHGRRAGTPPTVADASARAGWWRAVVPDSPLGLGRGTRVHLQVCHPAQDRRATGEAAGAAAAHRGRGRSPSPVTEPMGGSHWAALGVAQVAGAQGEATATPTAHELAGQLSAALAEHVLRRAEGI